MGGKTPESLMNRLELNEVDAMGIDAPGAEAMMAQLKDMPLAEEVQTKELPQRGYPHTPYHPGLKIDNSYPYKLINRVIFLCDLEELSINLFIS